MNKRKNLAFSIMTTLAITLQLNEVYDSNPYSITNPVFKKIFDLLVFWRDSIKYDSLVVLLIFIVCLFFFNLKIFEKAKYRLSAGIVAILIATLRTGSEFFLLESDLCALGVPIVRFKFVIKVVGYTVLLWHVLIAAEMLIPHLLSDKDENISFRKSVLYIGAGLLPNLIIRYPGAICWDAWYELFMYRNDMLGAHYPIAYTLLLGKVVGFFEKLGYASGGIFLIVLLQYVLQILVFAYSITLMNRMHISKRWKWCAILLYILNPYIAGYIGVVMYDVPYTACMLLFVFLLLDYIVDREAFEHDWRKLILVLFAILGAWLFRKNGPYILIPSLLAVTVLEIVRMVHIRKAHISRLLIVSVIACVCAVGANHLMLQSTNAAPDEMSSALSIPLQQTARICAKYDKEISKTDKQILKSVLDYDTMIVSYSQRISDPVTGCLRNDIESEDLVNFFKVWMKLALKHPLTAISATWGQNYYFFTPETSSVSIYQDTIYGYELGQEINIAQWVMYEPIFDEPAFLYNWKRLATTIYTFLIICPVFGIISNLAMQTLLFFIALWAIVNKREWIKLLYFIPLVFTILCVIAAPVIQGHLRYVFVMLYAMPITVAVTAWDSKRHG